MIGALIGYLIATMIGKATNQHSGLPFQVIAVFDVAGAYFVHNLGLSQQLFSEASVPTILTSDPSGYAAAIIAAAVACYCLR